MSYSLNYKLGQKIYSSPSLVVLVLLQKYFFSWNMVKKELLSLWFFIHSSFPFSYEAESKLEIGWHEVINHAQT